MSKDLMLLGGGHSVNRTFGTTIGAHIFKLKNVASKNQHFSKKAYNILRCALSIPAGYDNMICESAYFYPAIKRRLGLLGKTKIININCGPIFHHIGSGRIRGMEAKMLLDLFGEVDGHFVFGKYGSEFLKTIFPKNRRPIRIVYPFINEALRQKLLPIRPKLESQNITVIAAADPINKGLDLIFKALPKIVESHPDARVNVITRMAPEMITSVEGFDQKLVRVLSNVPDITDVLADSSLYLQPSRGDMFPTACIEAMTAGLPTIVSVENDAREMIEEVDDKAVVDLDSSKLADAVIRYFDSSLKDRQAMSDQSKKAAAKYNEKDMNDLFKEQFESMKKEL